MSNNDADKIAVQSHSAMSNTRVGTTTATTTNNGGNKNLSDMSAGNQFTSIGADGVASPELTIFIPVYNEVESLAPLHEKIQSALARLPQTTEIIYVDDGSNDGTIEELRRLAKEDKRVRVISFRRNYGKMAAMVAGIEAARAPVLVSMDADGQNDPDDIQRLLAKLDEGYEVVSGWRFKRQDSLRRTFPSKIANRVISKVSGVALHDYGCCLKAYRREALDGVNFYGEMHRFIPIYCAHQNGARIAELPVQHHPRARGVAKFGKLSRTFEVVLDLVTIRYMEAYRTKPMHLIGFAGLIAFGIASLTLVGSIAALAFNRSLLASLMFVMFALSLAFGVLLIMLGLVAETVMRTYYEAQAKPTFTVRETIGFDLRDEAVKTNALLKPHAARRRDGGGVVAGNI